MIPKRAVGALVTTTLALVLLLGFKTPAAPSLAATTASDSAIVGSPSATGVPSATEVPAATEGLAATEAPAATDSTSSSAAYVDGTVTGPVVSTRFGDVQVQVTISGGVIADVTALQLPSGDRHSAQISSEVEPWLRSSALEAQSANIDLVSGATYTSDAYARSLQAALDEAAA